ncbi:MAG: GDSL-type esterase/lipase family protein [Cytophagaceae bacterium]|nr:GDSL-type esterase/lipase family protein [Cytophagaceae bacterium]MDW8457172.1 SGNH/GDSL hydrolase family protein [Cytophagaceae bacterium]
MKAIIYSLLITTCVVSFACKKKSEDEPPQPQPDSPNVPADTTMITISADDPLIQYFGRIDFSNPKAPSYAYPGVSIRAKFQGPAIDVIIKDYGTGTASTTNFYQVIIDGVVQSTLRVNSTDTLYNISRTLSDSEHTIELFKRTEASVGKSSFKGLRIRKNKSLLPLPPKPTRKIEFIGNSITCGYGNEVSIPAPPSGNPNTGFNSVNENNYKAWGAITARALNAQYMCIAYSGRGLYRNNTGSTSQTMPLIYDRIFPDQASPLWTYSNYTPDVIVIGLGTNDFAPEAWATPNMLDSASFVNTYIAFIQTLRTHYPDAHIICVVSNAVSDYWPVGMKVRTRFKNYIQAVDTYFSADAKVHQLELPTQLPPYGEDWHPSAAEHQNMANLLIPFIKNITGWQ